MQYLKSLKERSYSMVANLGRLFSDTVVLVLLLVLEFFTIKPLVGDLIGYLLIGITVIILGLDFLKNIL